MFGVMCPPEHVWLGWVSFCIKQSSFCLNPVGCIICELCESVLALECCRSWAVAGVKAAFQVMAAAVESESFKSYFISFVFDVSSWGIRLKRERKEV
jgi:hypothetical protein